MVNTDISTARRAVEEEVFNGCSISMITIPIFYRGVKIQLILQIKRRGHREVSSN